MMKEFMKKQKNSCPQVEMTPKDLEQVAIELLMSQENYLPRKLL